LLAAVAAERGFPVVLGARPYVSFALPRLRRGVFVAKSMRFTSDLMTRFILGLGHHMVASDEESLVRFSHPDYYPWRFSNRSFSSLRHLFAWGPNDADMFRDYPGRGEVAVHATGNPRADLLREDVRPLFEADAAALRREHGRFILINTNFSFVNNFVPSLNLIQRGPADSAPRISRTGRGMSLDFALGMAAHQQSILDGFAGLLPALAEAFADRVIVMRPHPSENHDRWRALTRRLANVRVIHEGNVVPWLMAAEVLVHNGCTTAVEGAVLGTPTIAYRPIMADSYDYHLPNRLSMQTDSISSTLAAVADVLAGRSRGISAPDRNRILARHVETMPDRLAADRIVDVLVDQGYLAAQPAAPRWRRYAHAWLGTHIRAVVKQVNMRRPRHRNSAAYLRHRFPPLTAAEVNRRLRTLGRVLGRFQHVTAVSTGTDLFAIESGCGSRPIRARTRPSR
jgi:surface carbohydrate biosynthesis protein